MTQAALQSAALIQQQCPGFAPQVGIVLGSGLGYIAEQIKNPVVISYDDLPGFPACNVKGHSGQLFLGELEGVPTACLQGRAHYYEGEYEGLLTPVRTLSKLGCKTLLVTNASGSMREEIAVGSLVLIHDHINFQFNNPLVGPNDSEFGPRFVGMEDAYDPELRQRILAIAKDNNIPLTEGVYFGVLGPSFETPAEIRAFKMLGGDVVGMSTLPDVITARHCGMRVSVICAISNMAAGMSDVKLSHDVTLSGAKLAVDHMSQLILATVRQLSGVTQPSA